MGCLCWIAIGIIELLSARSNIKFFDGLVGEASTPNVRKHFGVLFVVPEVVSVDEIFGRGNVRVVCMFL